MSARPFAGGCAIITTNTPDVPATQGQSNVYKFALAAAEMAANTRAEDVVLLDLRGRSPVAEFFIIATGTSPRQMRTVAEEIQDLGKRMGFKAWQTSGFESAKWILVDCVNVVAHVFDVESRDFYDLEMLWGDCPRIDWRKQLGLPPAPAAQERIRTRDRFAESSGQDERDAEEEDARLDGRDLDEEEGDADVDEDADLDAPIVMELPDESTGSNSVEFVEIDPPTSRRKRGRAVYPTPIADEDAEEENLRPVSSLGGSDQSSDEDDDERDAESAADADVEGISKEDMPRRRITTRPMGGVSASLSSTMIGDSDEEEQRESHEQDDEEQGHQDEIPEAHEAAAEATTFAKRTAGSRRGLDVSTESASERPRGGKVLKSRKDMRGPKAGSAAPGPVNVDRAKAGVVKGKARKGAESGIVDAPETARPKKPVVKMSAKAAKAAPRVAAARGKKPAAAKRPAAKKAATASKKVASKSVAKKKPVAKKPAPKKASVKKASAKKAPVKKASAKKPAPKAKKR